MGRLQPDLGHQVDIIGYSLILLAVERMPAARDFPTGSAGAGGLFPHPVRETGLSLVPLDPP